MTEMQKLHLFCFFKKNLPGKGETVYKPLIDIERYSRYTYI